ncbi:hypothetical protein AB0F46_35415 [Streptomyces sp. NPDC026665]
MGIELGMSGPGWTVWAHSEHAVFVDPDPTPMNILARILITRALLSDD